MRHFPVLFLALILLSACWFRSSRPPRPAAPEPEPLEGTFVCGVDTLYFGGEKRGITWHFEQAPSPLQEKGQGIYVFLFHNEEYRYDAAETFRLRDTQGREHNFLLSSGPASASSLTLYDDYWPKGRTFTKTD